MLPATFFSLTMCAVAVATGTGNFQSGNHGSSNQIRGAPHCGSKVLFGSEYLTDLFNVHGHLSGIFMMGMERGCCNCANR